MAKTAYDTDLDRNPANYRLASAQARRAIGRVLILVCLLVPPALAQAEEPTITITVGNDKRSFTRDELLKRPDAATIDVARDVSYRMQMSYRAVPVASLLAGMKLPDDSLIEAVALDGFIAQLPPDLVLNTDNSKAVAWLAIEPADHPWPSMPGKDTSAGPFYIVWTGAGKQRSKRAMAVSYCTAGESAFARFALACAGCQFRAAIDRSGPRRPGPVCRAVPPLSQAEWRRCFGRRP
jgi:hypothetical protein